MLVKFEVLIIVHEQAFVQAFVLLIAYCLNFLQAIKYQFCDSVQEHKILEFMAANVIYYGLCHVGPF